MLSAAAYLTIAAMTATWFWRLLAPIIAGRALLIVAAVYGLLWPATVPATSIYGWVMRRLAPKPVAKHSRSEWSTRNSAKPQ